MLLRKFKYSTVTHRRSQTEQFDLQEWLNTEIGAKGLMLLNIQGQKVDGKISSVTGEKFQEEITMALVAREDTEGEVPTYEYKLDLRPPMTPMDHFDVVSYLNDLGQDGWQLINIDQRPKGVMQTARGQVPVIEFLFWLYRQVGTVVPSEKAEHDDLAAQAAPSGIVLAS